MTALSTRFDPSQGDPRAFRNALGQFGTGVTVITCMTPTGPLGITANSFASVSLTPPLVLWSPAKSSTRYPFFMAAEHYAIHVIGEDQREICNAFSRQGDPFEQMDWTTSKDGVPLIDNCLSRFECQQSVCHDAGDHSIIIGHVRLVTTRPGKPLLFFGGSFGRFDDTA